MSEAVIYNVAEDPHRAGVFFFEAMARNDAEAVLRPQFVDVGLARVLTVS
jgi:hypothetical protein